MVITSKVERIWGELARKMATMSPLDPRIAVYGVSVRYRPANVAEFASAHLAAVRETRENVYFRWIGMTFGKEEDPFLLVVSMTSEPGADPRGAVRWIRNHLTAIDPEVWVEFCCIVENGRILPSDPPQEEEF